MPEMEGTFVGVEAIGGMNVARRRSYPMSSFEKRAVEEGSKKPFYIYSVNPVHEWPVQHGQLGTILIQKCAKGKRVSTPTIIPGVIARQYDKGLGKKEWYIEEGIDIVEDILGCSKRYPSPTPDNNLTTFGVFYTDKPFEDLPAAEQASLISAATQKLIVKLQTLVLSADRLHSEGHGNWISQVHRDALGTLNDLSGGKEERPWAPIRLTAARVECGFCGAMNKPNTAKCANCHEIIDQELYRKLKKQQKEE